MTPETPLAMLTRSLLQSKLRYVKILSLFVTQIISKTYHVSPGTSIEQVGAGEAVRRSVNIVCSGNKNMLQPGMDNSLVDVNSCKLNQLPGGCISAGNTISSHMTNQHTRQ